MSASNARKSSYKLPPTIITDKLISQDARRNKALEEQKRRRALKIDSARQLDLFADLTLGDSDQEAHNGNPEPVVSAASVAPYALMLSQPQHFSAPSTISEVEAAGLGTDQGRTSTTEKKRPKKRSSKRSSNKSNNKWADRCMYAELLEMIPDAPCSLSSSNENGSDIEQIEDLDGLPNDLGEEGRWVALAPVPVGKRCLAVTQQSAGVSGIVPNTTLRSRLLGKPFLLRFPSSLPPLTVLDCILDANWRENGILHVLDVIKWKGQDVSDCESRFRFWWRDTRLSELANTPPPPSIQFLTLNSLSSTSSYTPPSSSHSILHPSTSSMQRQTKYHFPYPTTFIPVPYHSIVTLETLYQEVIPAANTTREVTVSLPMSPPLAGNGTTAMDIEHTGHQRTSNLDININFRPQIILSPSLVHVASDGLLLYMAEASYEPGTSPLSSWVPMRPIDDLENEEVALEGKERPLDLFYRLVRKRIKRRAVRTVLGGSDSERTSHEGHDVDMEI